MFNNIIGPRLSMKYFPKNKYILHRLQCHYRQIQLVGRVDVKSLLRRYCAKRCEMPITWCDESLFVLLNEVKRREEIWKTSHSLYKDRPLRTRAFVEVAEAVTEATGSEVSVDEIKKKLKSLKRRYAAEKRKLNLTSRSGAGADEVYVSNWHLFSQLTFLDDGAIVPYMVNNLPLDSQNGSVSHNRIL